jgi:hypothetical protein
MSEPKKIILNVVHIVGNTSGPSAKISTEDNVDLLPESLRSQACEKGIASALIRFPKHRDIFGHLFEIRNSNGAHVTGTRQIRELMLQNEGTILLPTNHVFLYTIRTHSLFFMSRFSDLKGRFFLEVGLTKNQPYLEPSILADLRASEKILTTLGQHLEVSS